MATTMTTTFYKVDDSDGNDDNDDNDDDDDDDDDNDDYDPDVFAVVGSCAGALAGENAD